MALEGWNKKHNSTIMALEGIILLLFTIREMHKKAVSIGC